MTTKTAVVIDLDNFIPEKLVSLVDLIRSIGGDTVDTYAVGIMPVSLNFTNCKQSYTNNKGKVHALRCALPGIRFVPVDPTPEAADITIAKLLGRVVVAGNYDQCLVASNDASVANAATVLNQIIPTWVVVADSIAVGHIPAFRRQNAVPFIRLKDASGGAVFQMN